MRNVGTLEPRGVVATLPLRLFPLLLLAFNSEILSSDDLRTGGLPLKERLGVTLLIG